MPDTSPCPRCNAPNDLGARFCASCGAGLTPEVRCAACNSLNPLGHRFCAQCGSALSGASWAGAGPGAGGVVSDGVWERGSDELVRRVEPDDARKFLGNRSVRVPPGSVGVVVIDGAVERVMPPGERTTLNVLERIGDFFLRREGRSAFYLIDTRPVPIPFVIQSRAAASGRAVRTQVLASFTLPRGDKAALGTFLANVVGARDAFGAADLHALLRPDVVRVAQETLERLAGGRDDVAYGEAEARMRETLQATLGPRYGLTVDVSLAPLTTIASLDFHLGRAPAPRVRACVQCRHELPASLAFCDRCGAKQPAVVDVAGEALSAESALFTRDGQQVELDLVVRVQGQHEDFAALAIAPALVAAAAQHLRQSAYAALASAGGLEALEAALRPGAEAALQAYGLTLVGLSAIDVKTKTGQWLLSARADLERARSDVAIGREWAAQRDDELDLEAMTLQLALKQQALARGQKLAEREADVADREARVGLDDRAAAVERAGIARRAAQDEATFEARRDGEVRARDARVDDERVVHAAALAREAARRELEHTTKDRDEARQIEKLRAMAALERESAAAEHAEVLEKRRQLEGLSPEAMIAMQAAELAAGEGGGAAWAAALAARVSADAERRHAGELKDVYGQAMDAMAKVASSRAEAGPAGSAGAVVPVTIAQAAPLATGGEGAGTAMVACKACGAGVRAGGKFCGACGAATGA